MTSDLSNSTRKLVRSLSTTKGRRAHSLFVAEGRRCVSELIQALDCRMLICSPEYAETYPEQTAKADELIVAPKREVEALSGQRTPQPVIGLFPIIEHKLDLATLGMRLTIALDEVQDPGNLGTIIRLADWFGITDVICSTTTVDVYNPKVVQSTMGAIARVNVHYTDLAELLANVRTECNVDIYGTFLPGDNLYETPLSGTGIIVMGNEGNGISPKVAEQVNHRLYIPPFPSDRQTVESLNVGVATAVIVSEFRRRQGVK